MVAYIRVSALMGRGGEDFHSPDVQHTAIRRHTAPLGLREVASVQDIDVSGRTFSRNGLDEIRQLVEAGGVDVVAVYDLSRLGRNAGEALRFIRWLRERRVGIISTVEKIDDSPEGQFILTQFLAMAELYSNQVGRNWSNIITHRARTGRAHGPIPPLGYQRADGGLVPDPVLGPIITELFRRYAAGDPLSELTRMLTAARGKPTRIQVTKKVLLNPTYLGKVVLWGTEHPTVNTVPAYLGDGAHAPLTDLDTWRQVRTRIEGSRWIPTRLRVPSHELVGLARCGLCGKHATRWLPGGRDPVVRLICAAKMNKSGCPGMGTPRLEDTVAAVLRRVEQYVAYLRSDPDAEAAVAARAAAETASVEMVKRELARVRTEMTKLTEGWMDGRVPDSVYDRMIGPLREAETSLQERAARADQPRPAGRQQRVALAGELLALWPEATLGERNRALRTVIRSVTIAPAQRWRQPVEERLDVEWC